MTYEQANKITLVPVETRSRTRMIRVDRAGRILGLIEKMPNSRTDTHPWKAFLGSGFGCRYLACFYGPEGKQQAVDCVVRAAAGIFVGTDLCA